VSLTGAALRGAAGDDDAIVIQAADRSGRCCHHESSSIIIRSLFLVCFQILFTVSLIVVVVVVVTAVGHPAYIVVIVKSNHATSMSIPAYPLSLSWANPSGSHWYGDRLFGDGRTPPPMTTQQRLTFCTVCPSDPCLSARSGRGRCTGRFYRRVSCLMNMDGIL
jgi:hypothetical protein